MPHPLADIAADVGKNTAAAVDTLLAEAKKGAPAVPYILSALDPLLQAVGGKAANDVKAKLTEALETMAKVDDVNESAVRELGVPVAATRAKESTKWQEKVLALRLLELWSSSCPDAVSESMVMLVPLLSELMWDSKEQVKTQAKTTLAAACRSIDNVDLEPFIPQLIQSIAQPETVEDCIQGLSGTTFVQAVRAPALSITVPLLDRGFKVRGKVAVVRQTAKITENLAKLVQTPSDVAPFMPVLGPALAKAKQDVSDPECRSRCAAAHDALIAIGTFDDAAQKAKEAENTKIRSQVSEGVKAVMGAGASGALVAYVSAAVASLVRDPKMALVEAWQENLTPSLGGGNVSGGADGVKKLVADLHAKLSNVAAGTTTQAEVMEDDATGNANEDVLCDCRFSLAYGSKILLNQARMRLLRGHRYGLVGLKAAGKTTLMKAISNNQVEGFPTPDQLKTVFVEADVIHVPETVIEYTVSTIQQLDPKATKEDIIDGLRKVGFDDEHLNKPVWNLSGGWRIKLAVAKAMIRKADILLMDQPTNHLDVKNIEWVKNYITGEDCKKVTFILVTHDLKFANSVLTNVIFFTPALKLDTYTGNMEHFFEKHPECRDMFDITKSDTPFVFPPPAPIEGLKNRGSKCLALEHVTFSYPGQTSPQLIDVTCRVAMASRIACVGPNGAGKSTLIKLLMGALTPTTGTVYRHPNVRIAYVGQHAFEYIQDHLQKTPNEYIRWRYGEGDDKEALNKANMVLTEEEQKIVEKPWEIVFTNEDGKTVKEKRVAEKLVGRRKEGRDLLYEVKWKNKPQDANTWVERQELLDKGFEKWVAALDRRKLAAEGAYVRTLTAKNVEDHLIGVGLDSESATHVRMAQLSSGQRIKVVLAAALWYLPHLLVLDEPTNYASRDDLASLVKAINQWEGGILLITHSEEFAKATTRETWVVNDHRLTVSGDADWTALEKEAVELGLNYKEEDQVDAAGNKVTRDKKRTPDSLKPKEKKEMMRVLKSKIEAGSDLSEFEEACANEWKMWG